MTVRFSVTIDLHDVPSVRHIRDIEETIRLAVRRLCCKRDDRLLIESGQIEAPVVDSAADGWIAKRPPAIQPVALSDEERRRA